MKIEICEQMVQSWLQHYKQCEIVQTNWKVSPLRLRSISDLDIAELEKFMKKFEEELNQVLEDETKVALQDAVDEELLSEDDAQLVKKRKSSKIKKLNIFKKNKAKQFIRQCEIDVVGCKLDDGITEHIYLVDTAFHKTGLGYHDAVATVVKKIIRAVVVAVIIFGESAPVTVAFVSPKCGDTLRPQIEAVIAGLSKILSAHHIYRNIDIELYFNEKFTSDIYVPLLNEVDELNDDNDLFMRAMNLAKVAETYRVGETLSEATSTDIITSSSVIAIKKVTRGSNRDIVFDIITDIINNGKMTTGLLGDLQTPSYAKTNFKLPTFSVLVTEADLISRGYERCRFYNNSIEIFGVKYLVCSQWIPERIARLKAWYASL